MVWPPDSRRTSTIPLLDDLANLVGGDDIAVELVGVVLEIVVQLFPALLASFAVLLFHLEARFDSGTLLRDGRADAEHVA